MPQALEVLVPHFSGVLPANLDIQRLHKTREYWVFAGANRPKLCEILMMEHSWVQVSFLLEALIMYCMLLRFTFSDHSVGEKVHCK